MITQVVKISPQVSPRELKSLKDFMAVEWKDPLNNNAHIILKVGIKQGAQSLLLHWDVVNLLLFQPSLLLFLSFLH